MNLADIRKYSGRQLTRIRRFSGTQLSRLTDYSGKQITRFAKYSGQQFSRIRKASSQHISAIRKHVRPEAFTRMEIIRSGQASENITEGCLVLEGGAFRGLYSQGALDALMENDLNFSCVIGVSAGALSGLNYCSGQIGRSARINLSYRHDSRYVGIRALREAHSPVNLDFILKDVNAIEPFNWKCFNNPERRFVAVCANVETGEVEYFEKNNCDILSAVKASASMPYISPEVIVDGKPCLDGGTCCKIPYQWAIDQGYDKIVVIRTRDRTFRKKNMTKENELADVYYRHNQRFAKALADSNINYNRQCDELIKLEKQRRIYVIAPQKPVTVSRVEADLEKLGDLYLEGYQETCEQIEKLREYLRK